MHFLAEFLKSMIIERIILFFIGCSSKRFSREEPLEREAFQSEFQRLKPASWFSAQFAFLRLSTCLHCWRTSWQAIVAAGIPPLSLSLPSLIEGVDMPGVYALDAS